LAKFCPSSEKSILEGKRRPQRSDENGIVVVVLVRIEDGNESWRDADVVGQAVPIKRL
jgi:hypothetical protein